MNNLPTPLETLLAIDFPPKHGWGVWRNGTKPAARLITWLALTVAASELIGSPAPGTKLWEATLADTVCATPVLHQNGNIYVATGRESQLSAGYLQAFSPEGVMLWFERTAGGALHSSPSVGSDGSICLGTDLGKLMSFSPEGITNWVFTASLFHPVSSPAVGSDGTIYVRSDIGGSERLYSVSPQGGTNWSAVLGKAVPVANTQLSSPAVGPDGTIYVVSGLSNLYAFSPSGTTNWIYRLPCQIFSSPGIGSDGTLFFGAEDKAVYAISPQGNLKWRHPVTLSAPGFIESSPALAADDSVYVGLYAPGQGGLLALTSAGERKWFVNFGNGAGSSPAIDAAGNVYFTELTSPTLHAVDASGSNTWSFSLGTGGSFISPVIGPEGVVYIAHAKKLYAIQGGNPPMRSAWPMFRGGPRHSARSPQRGLRSSPANSDGSIPLTVTTELDGLYTLQVSSNLTDWSDTITFTSTNRTMTFTQPATNGIGFYRLQAPVNSPE
jgi:outer membrane protein assembly factor BamB